MDFDRYQYVRSNPVNSTDPSGHCTLPGGYWQDDSSGACQWVLNPPISAYGITLTGAWTDADKVEIQKEAHDISIALQANCHVAECVGLTAAQTFNLILGDFEIHLYKADEVPVGESSGAGCKSTGTINCWPGARGNLTGFDKGVMIHEIFHKIGAGDNNYGDNLLAQSTIVDANGNFVSGYDPVQRKYVRTARGYVDDKLPYVMHPTTEEPGGWTPGEDFADMGLNYVRNSFDYSINAHGAGSARYTWMATNLSDIITRTINSR